MDSTDHSSSDEPSKIIPLDIDGLSLSKARNDLNAADRLNELGFKLQEEKHRRQRWETHLRTGLSVTIMIMFLAVNFGVGFLIYGTYTTEMELIRLKIITSADRTITSGVYMALIGGSVVQVGAGIATILAYLFPKHDKNDSNT